MPANLDLKQAAEALHQRLVKELGLTEVLFIGVQHMKPRIIVYILKNVPQPAAVPDMWQGYPVTVTRTSKPVL